MNLSKLVSAFSFIGALTIGISVGYVANLGGALVFVEPASVVEAAPVSAENLVGVWRGTWGYNRADCKIEIDRIDGKKFYGTLRKGGAEIAFVGTVDVDARTISFEETEVLEYGEYSGWSLGTNSGSFTHNGRALTGTGTDEYGTYGWDAAKD